MTKEKKEIEYPDAPSGFVTLYNYKEPFMPFREGYGYEGVLLFDGLSDKIQCHLCGDWYEAMGNHLHREHNMTASAYKEKVGLRQTTALVSETLRAKMIANGMDKRLQNLRAGGKKTQEEKDKIRATLKKVCREKENETDTCPLQLIERLQVLAKKLGRTPTERECHFKESIQRVYGSFKEACSVAGIEYRVSGETISRRQSKYSKEMTVNFVKNYWINNKQFPKWRVFPNKTMYRRYLQDKKEIKKEILHGEGIFQRTGERFYYSKEELLDTLKKFKEINNRDASISDCKRGLLPHASRYYYHFGNLKNALAQLK